ncbi:MAG: virulence factor [Bryobacteraceae bacterium]|nr:virulence factor [Bryobacteraceae bacterium]MDW8378836.1 virulence factor [Bryobacterales bacterium]
MTTYQVLYWKHIPAQIKVQAPGKRPLSVPLPERFQQEIDRVAMKEGLAGTDTYLEQWHWSEKRQREGTAEEVVQAVLQELIQAFDSAR